MATKSTKGPPQELDEDDLLRIGYARAVLQGYGLYVDVAEMSDVAYEQRQVRMKSMDLAVAAITARPEIQNNVVDLAAGFYRYIWEGHGHGAV